MANLLTRILDLFKPAAHRRLKQRRVLPRAQLRAVKPRRAGGKYSAFDPLNDLNRGGTSSYVTLSKAPKEKFELRFGKKSTE